jgi:hypothetical protein
VPILKLKFKWIHLCISPVANYFSHLATSGCLSFVTTSSNVPCTEGIHNAVVGPWRCQHTIICAVPKRPQTYVLSSEGRSSTLSLVVVRSWSMFSFLLGLVFCCSIDLIAINCLVSLFFHNAQINGCWNNLVIGNMLIIINLLSTFTEMDSGYTALHRNNVLRY